MSWRDYPCRVVSKSLTQSQYRRLYQQLHGPLSSDQFVCHYCDNRLCDEPNHWFVGTTKDNTQDCIAKGRFHYHTENLSRYQPQRWVKNGTSKLSNADVRAIRASTVSSLVLGPKYGVSAAVICRVRRRATWKHVA